ncbi:hypothetical protein NPIL_691911 [Nephila pilipes]|uniref:Uncharacterized protein n=1 Tax=Nephila pilipes TaxID=299642 RepID=A0A8X6TS72_NEPPI|nr:hypothetical protein NPIL_691911 [Nephila pilipes]
MLNIPRRTALFPNSRKTICIIVFPKQSIAQTTFGPPFWLFMKLINRVRCSVASPTLPSSLVSKNFSFSLPFSTRKIPMTDDPVGWSPNFTDRLEISIFGGPSASLNVHPRGERL